MTADQGPIVVYCGTCIGLGGWDRETGKPRRRATLRLFDQMWHRCPLCGGTGSILAMVRRRDDG